MEIPSNWRRLQALNEFINKKRVSKTISQKDLKHELVEGGKTRSADDAIVSFCSYVARMENWGDYGIVEHPFLGSFSGVIDVTDEIGQLKVKVKVGE